MVATSASAKEIQKADSGLRIIRDVAGLRQCVREWRNEGQKVALVPTMGAIHKGHISLVHAAQKQSDRVIVSLFVNPKQFGPAEDVTTYPVDEASDAGLLSEAGVDILYAPSFAVMYPDGFVTTVSLSDVTAPLCGEFRPGHFAGVATVVSKLRLQAAPDLAVFGEKDYQQLLVIRRLVKDLDIPVDIVGAPTIRESDGLAVSSRNAYLSPAERAKASLLYTTLQSVADQVAAGQRSLDDLCRAAEMALKAAGFREIDYVSVRDAETLQAISTGKNAARVFGAAWLGRARLIDNVVVPD
jgi:pantoate--beta-alanine ligase